MALRRQRRVRADRDEDQARPGGDVAPSVDARMLALQRAAGNRATTARLQRTGSGVGEMVIQGDWLKLLPDGTTERQPGDKPLPGTHNIVRTHKDATKDLKVWKPKGAAPVKGPTYDERVGDLPDKDDHTTTFEVAATDVRFSQDSISQNFQEGSSGTTIHATARALKDKALDPKVLGPFRVTRRNGKLVSLDNRRLWCCREAGVRIECVWATSDAIKARDFTAGKNGKTTIELRT